jgi:hypothetical protein
MNKKILVLLVFLICFTGCSEYFAFRITGKLINFEYSGKLTTKVRCDSGYRTKKVDLQIVGSDSVIIEFDAITEIPKYLSIYGDSSLLYNAEFIFDRNKKKGFLFSPTTNQKVEFKKRNNKYGDLVYVAEGFFFK